MTIANPIYDIVFKYLMEDERIARTILSALLKRNVVAVQMRPHEYSDDQHELLSVYRIDFGATIRHGDGSEELILIELQKTWLETETLRFRQYLGVHYSNPKNMREDGNALPMVSVYLLGHKVGEIEEPVLYVRHRSYDYDDRLVTKGLPHPFIDSLTHDSIIVQIPRLHGQINNRLDMVLSIFDQSRTDAADKRLLNVDDSAYGGDAEMGRILHRLTMAAADAGMRHKMNVEDEYFSAIEKRDMEIQTRDKILAEKQVQINEQQSQITEQQSQITEQQSQITEQQSQITEQQSQITEQQSQITEQQSQITEQQSQITEQQSQLVEKDEMLRSTIHLLLDAGMTVEEISIKMHKDIDIVRQLAL